MRMIKKILLLNIFILLFVCVNAQNVGQPGNDSIINYTDIQGNKQGKWIRKYDKDHIAYTATFKNNWLVGEYKRYYASGALKADILYNMDGSVGYAKLYWDNGKLMAKGKYVQQHIKDSVWEYYGTDGVLMAKETYVNGVLNGMSCSYFRNGNYSKTAPYVKGKINGVYKEYIETGLCRLEITYSNGVRQGPLNVYYDDGHQYLKANYDKDLAHGKWTIYFRNGKVDRELEYDHGELKNADAYNEAFKKQMKEWESMKGKIPEPREEDFFNPQQRQKEYQNEY